MFTFSVGGWVASCGSDQSRGSRMEGFDPGAELSRIIPPTRIWSLARIRSVFGIELQIFSVMQWLMMDFGWVMWAGERARPTKARGV